MAGVRIFLCFVAAVLIVSVSARPNSNKNFRLGE